MRPHVSTERSTARDSWKTLRLRKLESASWRCQRCSRRPAREVHHLDKHGAPFPPMAGLEVLCRMCHVDEHATPLSRDKRAWMKFAFEFRGEPSAVTPG